MPMPRVGLDGWVESTLLVHLCLIKILEVGGDDICRVSRICIENIMFM